VATLAFSLGDLLSHHFLGRYSPLDFSPRPTIYTWTRARAVSRVTDARGSACHTARHEQYGAGAGPPRTVRAGIGGY
jgi:hypothetical protein